MKIITINVNGVRSAARKGFYAWLRRQAADVVCLQELKAQAEQIEDPVFHPKGYHEHFHFAEKKGYSGVAIYCRKKPRTVIHGCGWKDVDAEGRYLEAQYPGLSIISLYVHSGSSSPERQQVKFGFLDRLMPYLEALRRKRRQFIICGDWNIAHKNIDLKNHAGWRLRLRGESRLRHRLGDRHEPIERDIQHRGGHRAGGRRPACRGVHAG